MASGHDEAELDRMDRSLDLRLQDLQDARAEFSERAQELATDRRVGDMVESSQRKVVREGLRLIALTTLYVKEVQQWEVEL